MEGFATLFLMVSHAKIGASTVQSRATAGVAGATFIFCLPGSPGACRDAWDGILAAQLDYRTRPCNFVEIMPRLDGLRRHVAAGETGTAGGDDRVNAWIGNPALDDHTDSVDVVDDDLARCEVVAGSGQPVGQRRSGFVVLKRACVGNRQHRDVERHELF